MREKTDFGESLVKEGIITVEQLNNARSVEKKSGRKLSDVLIGLGLITEEEMAPILSSRLGLLRIKLADYVIDRATIDIVPESLARKYQFIPVLKIDNKLVCAMVDPENLFALDEIRSQTDLIIEPAVATRSEVDKGLEKYYGVKSAWENIIKDIQKEQSAAKEVVEGKDDYELDVKKLEGMADEPAVIRLVNEVIAKAIGEGASDIHFDPEKDRMRIRFRVDGMLHPIPSPPKNLHAAVVSRIKIMANLNIAERRRPQDGRFNIKAVGKEIDVRVSSMPNIFGEAVVLRLLDAMGALLSLNDQGFPVDVLGKYNKLILKPHGIILVTGPTGSGKTTTLYSSLDKINTDDKNIITIEDPVEYNLQGIRQIQVNPKVDLTFANGLRSILRQDPNVIMVGEIRDRETAEIAIHAALTGHLVLSTLHTNDALGAITRLADMGIEPFLIAHSVIGVLGQRLVRKICKDCKEEYAPSDGILKDLGLDDKKRHKDFRFYEGKGCPNCSRFKYKGRIGIFELLCVDEKTRGLIVDKAPIAEIWNYAHSAGMGSMREDGIKKSLDGITTLEEVLRVTQE